MSKAPAEPRGRTETKRSAILDVATTLFLRNGFLGTSMDEVATLASVSKQTVYKQFASKEALFLGIVESLTSRAAQQVQVGMNDPPDTESMADELRGHADRLLTIALTPKLLQLRRLVIGEASRFPALAKALYEGGPGRAIRGLAAELECWAQRGLLAIDDPLLAATQFNWLIMGEPVNRAMFYGDDDAKMTPAQKNAHIGAGVRVFLSAYGPP